jgi:hypothetical protein
MARIVLILLFLIVFAGCGGGITSFPILDYDTLIKDGWDMYNQSRYTEAYQLFARAKTMDEKRPDGYIGSGWTLLRLQHPDSAIVVFRIGLPYVTSLQDSVDTLCGLSGSHLARGEDANVISLFKQLKVSSYDPAFPLKKHDVFLDKHDLEIVQAMAYYHLGYYSAAEKADPENAVYYVKLAVTEPFVYKDPQSLMKTMTDFLDKSKSGYSF